MIQIRGCGVWLLAWTCFQGHAGEGLFVPPESVRGLALPLYRKGEPRPYAAIRVERFVKDYERRGFFKIGLLPVIVADGVTIELLQPDRTLAAFDSAARLTKQGGEAVEWRNVQLVFGQESTPRLRAARMRFSKDGRWRLWDVRLRTGDKELKGTEARLTIEPRRVLVDLPDSKAAIHLVTAKRKS